jgi:hypothetical protein
MFEDDTSGESFEETLRAIAREVGRSVERAMDNVDLSEFADTLGVDPGVAREWAESATGWLRAQAGSVGNDMTPHVRGSRQTAGSEDPLRRATSHPLDLPTEEQGVALAALDSGRWTVEPGTDALGVKGDGPGPSNALGIVRELRVRDWISTDGEITLVGRHALSRWLGATALR